MKALSLLLNYNSNTVMSYNYFIYKRLKVTVAIEKNMLDAYTLVGDTKKSRESFHKILDGELALSAIRLNFLRHNELDKIPDFF